MELKDIFDVYSYHQITDEELYLTEGDIPVYTGNNDLKGFWNKTFIDDIETILPCISFPLKGNNDGFSTIQKKPFDANNTGLIVPKDAYKKLVNLEWFTYKLRSILISVQTNKEGVSFINKDIVEKVEIDLPLLEIQNKELEYYKKLDKVKTACNKIREKYTSLSNKTIFFKHDIEVVKLNTILNYISRNDALSEEGIYNNGKMKSDDDTVSVLSGSTENVYYGEIRKDALKVHTLDNKQGLHIITRGKAGKLTYVPKGVYATNTNAFLIYLLDDVKKELKIKNEADEQVYLKFLKIYLEPIFMDISSNSDLGVFPLTKVFTEMDIPKFILSKEIKDIVGKHESLTKIESEIEGFLKKIEGLISKDVV